MWYIHLTYKWFFINFTILILLLVHSSLKRALSIRTRVPNQDQSHHFAAITVKFSGYLEDMSWQQKIIPTRDCDLERVAIASRSPRLSLHWDISYLLFRHMKRKNFMETGEESKLLLQVAPRFSTRKGINEMTTIHYCSITWVHYNNFIQLAAANFALNLIDELSACN